MALRLTLIPPDDRMVSGISGFHSVSGQSDHLLDMPHLLLHIQQISISIGNYHTAYDAHKARQNQTFDARAYQLNDDGINFARMHCGQQQTGHL